MTSLNSLESRTVFFYGPGEIGPTGSGSAMRQFTNLRAYLDFGFRVEVIQFINRSRADVSVPKKPDVDVPWIQVEYIPRPVSLLHRLAFYAGFPRSFIMEILFPVRPFVLRELAQRVRLQPDAIHHFEYVDMASAAVDFPGIYAIWSCHDIFSQRVPLLWEMRKTATDRLPPRYRRVRVQRLRQAEDWVAQSQKIILNIAWHENQEFRQKRGYKQAHFFPMSWPDENFIPRSRARGKENILRLLHLGSVDGFLGYDSLRFLLAQVFPLLTPAQLARLELHVVGKMGQGDYVREIQALVEPYPQVKFMGFADDIRQAYAEADVQVIGGERATGMRTRIIESFVYGLPVISTIEAARGVAELRDGENIFLAEDAPAFARALAALLENPAQLDGVAITARQTYDSFYSRSVASAKLAGLLEKYI